MSIIVMTGVTSGLGLATITHLVRDTDARFIVGVRNPDTAADLRAAVPADRLTVLPLDVSLMSSVRSFADGVIAALGDGKIDALGLNAGLQFTGPQGHTPEGVEVSFATNHLGHYLLAHLLMPHMATGSVVASTCSGTHDPDEKLASMFGFRGALFPSAERVAQGDLCDEPVSDEQAGMDLYATSKLCNIYFVRDMAKRIKQSDVRFVGLDPGLMAGTGLARTRGGVQKWAWSNLLPAITALLGLFGARVSTPEKSGRMLAQLLSGQTALETGAYIDFRGEQAVMSQLAHHADNAAALYDHSAQLSGIARL